MYLPERQKPQVPTHGHRKRDPGTGSNSITMFAIDGSTGALGLGTSVGAGPGPQFFALTR